MLGQNDSTSWGLASSVPDVAWATIGHGYAGFLIQPPTFNEKYAAIQPVLHQLKMLHASAKIIIENN